ncbi:MAG: hypothetical protein ABI586_01780 [Candidatus Nanopelagicales bacterium]
MSEQTPPDPPTQPEPTPYGSPPPPPATNPYAAPAESTPPPPPSTQGPTAPVPEAIPPAGTPVNPYATPAPTYAAPPAPYGTPPPPPGYAAPTYAAPGYPPGQGSQGAGGLAITALVLSIIAALTSWIPFVSVLALVLALAGLVLGIVAWSKAGKSQRPKGMAVSATIVSAIAILVAAAMTALSFWLGDIIVNCSDSGLTSAQQNKCVEDGVNNKLGIQY